MMIKGAIIIQILLRIGKWEKPALSEFVRIYIFFHDMELLKYSLSKDYIMTLKLFYKVYIFKLSLKSGVFLDNMKQETNLNLPQLLKI